MGDFYRALVVDNKDPQKKGRVKVWIPDTMSELNPKEGKGLWAMPANNATGGRNSDYGSNYMGSSMVPQKNSYVWVFYEKGNPNRPWYFGSADLQDAPPLPECQTGEYNKKWCLFKSGDGRAVTVSDDPSDARIEITGKKRQINNPPSGDTESVYNIDGNQSSILIDEINGKEKILIRSYKGDFIMFDVDDRELKIYFDGDVTIKSGKNLNLSSEGNMNIVSHGNLNIQSDGDISKISGGNQQNLCSGDIKNHSKKTYQNSGATPDKVDKKEYNGNRNEV